MDYYSVLGVERGASKDDIKRAYRKLAMQYHPDRNGGDAASEKKFKEVNEAYSVLSDDAKRQQYDTFGSVGGASGFGGGGFNVDVDLGDIFESFFGGGMGGSARRSTERRGEDLEYSLHIDLKTSIFGGKETIRFVAQEACDGCDGEGGSGKKQCPNCGGTGRVTTTKQSVFGVIQKTLTCSQCSGTGESFEHICSSCSGEKRVKKEKEIVVDIPAGINDGMIIKLSEEGNAGVGMKASGDLYIRFSVDLEEKGLKREGEDLYYDLEIDVIEAILGTKKEISLPILGKRMIEIAAGTSHGTVIKLSGDGVKHIHSETKGDLYITLELKIPKKLSKAERELYENIAKERKLNVKNGKGIFEKLFG